MDFKKSLKDVLVLVIICAVFATVLAAVNSVTAPIIADRLEQAANEAYFSVMEGATGFETLDLSQYTLPKTVPSDHSLLSDPRRDQPRTKEPGSAHLVTQRTVSK